MRRTTAAFLTVALAVQPALAGWLIDYDGDGRISREEFANAVAAAALHFDRNGDGIIGAREFPWTEADRSLFDNNRDGRVTSVGLQEFQDGMMLAFEFIDSDGDSYLSNAELRAAEGRYGILR